MQNTSSNPPVGRVASLHLHPATPGAPLTPVTEIHLVQGLGIQGEPHYFARVSRDTGKPSRRQVTLIEREQIAKHAAALGLAKIEPGAVRSNIETTGLNLVALVGKSIDIGEAALLLYAPRDPCDKMDEICQGLRQFMLHQRQGVLAKVLRSGTVRVGDMLRLREH